MPAQAAQPKEVVETTDRVADLDLPNVGPVRVNVSLHVHHPGRDPRQVRKNLATVTAEFTDTVIHEATRRIQASGYVRVDPDYLPPEPGEVPWVKMQPTDSTHSLDRLVKPGADGLPGGDPTPPGTTVWVNDRYVAIVTQVADNPMRPSMSHVSIRRADRAAVHDWRDLQRIKNDIFGPESEAAELYPAESRLVDSANQFHLWVIEKPGVRFPFGFDKREVAEGSGRTPDMAEGRHMRQRDWHPENRPADAADNLTAEPPKQKYV